MSIQDIDISSHVTLKHMVNSSHVINLAHDLFNTYLQCIVCAETEMHVQLHVMNLYCDERTWNHFMQLISAILESQLNNINFTMNFAMFVQTQWYT